MKNKENGKTAGFPPRGGGRTTAAAMATATGLGGAFQNWLDVAGQPTIRLVAMLDESVAYDRHWTLPFHALSLCVRDNGADPSWAELPESGRRMPFEPGAVHFTLAGTPMRLRYTTANRHLCIHFRCELLPGVDLFGGRRGRFRLESPALARRIEEAFADSDPLRRLARAETAALEAIVPFWPDRPPVDPERAAPFESVLFALRDRVDARTGTADMAAAAGWSEPGFSRAFRAAFGVSPKQWLLHSLFDRALRLLSDPRLSVKEAAYRLNFSTEFNFSRFVKRRSGFSPTQLREGTRGPLLDRSHGAENEMSAARF